MVSDCFISCAGSLTTVIDLVILSQIAGCLQPRIGVLGPLEIRGVICPLVQEGADKEILAIGDGVEVRPSWVSWLRSVGDPSRNHLRLAATLD